MIYAVENGNEGSYSGWAIKSNANNKSTDTQKRPNWKLITQKAHKSAAHSLAARSKL
jgi:hypothetical protein